jgi:hypothetical protein
MILAVLVAASLILPVSINPSAMPAPPDRGQSVAHKRAVLRPLVTSVTSCIARSVSADPRFPVLARAGDVNELIVDSVPHCLNAVQTMIDAYDRLFGAGSGESFFFGPFLDELPSAVDRLVRGAN